MKPTTAPTRALVVYCHPSPDSLVAAARDTAVRALEAAGAEVRLTDLYADGFEPEFTIDDRAMHLTSDIDPALSAYAADLVWCDTLILVYPTWWAGQPAMLKGWIDRVWVKGVAWELPDGANRLTPLLRNIRRIVAITTHGSPKYINTIEGEGGKRTVTRSLRAMCHLRTRTNWLALYNVDRSTPAQRTRFLGRIEKKLSSLV